MKFFRKIRQRLLSEHKLKRYVVYALGEIVLVVIGILIALQANNYNEQRKLDHKIKKFLPKLKYQIEGNLTRVSEELEALEYFYTQSQVITNKNIGFQGTINPQKIDSLILFTGSDFHLNLDMITLVEAQSNENLTHISSDTLREALYGFVKTHEMIVEREKIINEDLNLNFKPFLNKHYNLKNLIHHLGYAGLEPSQLAAEDLTPLLQSQLFENLIVTRVLYLEDLVILYALLKEKLETVNQLLEQEIGQGP